MVNIRTSRIHANNTAHVLNIMLLISGTCRVVLSERTIQYWNCDKLRHGTHLNIMIFHNTWADVLVILLRPWSSVITVRRIRLMYFTSWTLARDKKNVKLYKKMKEEKNFLKEENFSILRRCKVFRDLICFFFVANDGVVVSRWQRLNRKRIVC